MPVPSNYNSTVLVVRSQDMKTASDALVAALEEINNRLGNISKKLADLRLAWAGPDSADKMQKFAADWMDLMTRLFGTEKDPNRGILNMLYAGAAGAAGNFALNEESIVSTFMKFEVALGTVEQQFNGTVPGGTAPGNSVDEPWSPPTKKTPPGEAEVEPPKNFHTTAVNETGF